MPHTDRPGFSPEIFSKWCRLDRVVRGHARTICDSLHQPDKTLTEECAVIRQKPFENLEDVSALIDRRPEDVRYLRRGLSVCQGLGDLYEEGQCIPSVSLGDGRYLLFPDRTGPIRDAYPEGERFKLEAETGFSLELELDYRWFPTPADIDIVPVSGDFLRGTALRKLRIGLAPFLDRTELNISFHEEFPREPDGSLPFHCCGYKPPVPDLTERLEKVLRSAYSEGVHILLLPELCVDETLLAFTQEWLQTNNLRNPVLRMVVAGSRHYCDRGFKTIRNRCTVLNGGGSILWEQDKFNPFDLDESSGLALSTLPPGGKGYEPKTPGKVLYFAKTSLLGTLVTPICIDYLKGDNDSPFHQLPSDVYLVPSMSATLKSFRDRSRTLGKKRAAATFVANALCGGEVSDRVHAYIAVRRRIGSRRALDDLYISDILVK